MGAGHELQAGFPALNVAHAYLITRFLSLFWAAAVSSTGLLQQGCFGASYLLLWRRG